MSTWAKTRVFLEKRWPEVAAALLACTAIALPTAPLLDLFHAHPAGLGDHAALGVWYLRSSLVLLAVVTLLLAHYPAAAPGPPMDPVRTLAQAPNWKMMSLILVPALALRIYDLDEQLWFDEILVRLRFVDVGTGAILTTFDANNHLLYSLLADVSDWVFGPADWALRLPALVFGVMSIAALYALASLAVGAREALLSAALLSVSYHHIWFSQNARGYTMALFWTLASSYFLLRALREERPRRMWVGFAVTAALGVSTMDLHAFVVAAQLLVYLTYIFLGSGRRHPDRFSGLFFGFLLASALGFVTQALALPQKLAKYNVIDRAHTELWHFSDKFDAPIAKDWFDPMWAIQDAVERMDSVAGSFVLLCALIALGIGTVQLLRRAPAVVALVPLSVLPILSLVLIDFPLFPRFFFFAAGFMVLIVITGVVWLGDWFFRILPARVRPPLDGGIAAALVVVAVSAATVPPVYAPKQDYLAAMAFIHANRRPTDRVAAIGRTASLPFNTYYGRDWLELGVHNDRQVAIDRLRSRAEPTWAVYTLPEVLESEAAEVLKIVQTHGEERARFPGTLGGGDVIVRLLPEDQDED